MATMEQIEGAELLAGWEDASITADTCGYAPAGTPPMAAVSARRWAPMYLTGAVVALAGVMAVLAYGARMAIPAGGLWRFARMSDVQGKSHGQETTAAKDSSSFTAYWDIGECGPHGNDANVNICGGKESGKCPGKITMSTCPSGVATLAYQRGDSTGGYTANYWESGCGFVWFAQYECQGEMSTERKTDATRARDATDRLPAAIYVLVQGDDRRFDMLMRMLASVERHFNNVYKYPIVVFEEDLSETQKTLVARASKNRAIFEHMQLTTPSWVTDEDVTTGICDWRSVGYKNMCRFQAMEASSRLRALGFEWQWRLDDDSSLTADIPYDIFERMARNGASYGFIWDENDSSDCVTGLWELAKEHAQNIGLPPSSAFWSWPEGRIHYNNFEVSRTSFWSSPEYQAWFDRVDKAKGIYKYRWGDAPIKTIGVAMFLRPDQVLLFDDIGYHHDWADTSGWPAGTVIP